MAKRSYPKPVKWKPRNPKKYMGDPTNIVARSSWEKIVFIWLDSSPACVGWSSEEFFIPYVSPVDGKVHRYFVDAKAIFEDSTGKKKTVIIEIKPYAQTLMPVAKKGKSKVRLMEEAATYAINDAKWTAAREYCRVRGYEFQIITEYEIGLKKRT